MNKGRKLGRGLDALIPKMTNEAAAEVGPKGEKIPEVIFLSPEKITVNRAQPRLHFQEGAIDELAQSIDKNGILQPLVVRHLEDGSYELVAGERRLRASKQLGLEHIPVLVREVKTEKLAELALIENIQREDLNPIEIAIAYKSLLEEHSWTQGKLAEQVGKKRSSVANTMRYLDLPDSIQQSLAEGAISAGHAKVLLGAPDDDMQASLHQKLLTEKLSVRALEDQLAQQKIAKQGPVAIGEGAEAKPQQAAESQKSIKPPHVIEQEDIFSRGLGTKVQIKEGKNGRGKITIEYYSLKDFDRIKMRMLRDGNP